MTFFTRLNYTSTTAYNYLTNRTVELGSRLTEKLQEYREFSDSDWTFDDTYTMAGLVANIKSCVKHGLGATVSVVFKIIEMARSLSRKFFGFVAGLPLGDMAYAGACIIILMASYSCGIPDFICIIASVILDYAYCDNNFRLAMALATKSVLAYRRSAVNVSVNCAPTINNVRYHALDDNLPEFTGIVTAIGSMLCCVLSGIVCKNLPTSRDFDTLLKRMKDVPQALKGCIDMSDALQRMFVKVTNMTLDYYHGKGTIDSMVIPSEVSSNSASVLRLARVDVVSQIPTNNDLVEEIGELYNNYQSYRIKYSRNRTVQNYLDRYNGAIAALYARACAHTLANNEYRATPTTVMFRGNSGVGKSGLLRFVCADILAREGIFSGENSDEEVARLVKENVYSRAAEQEFWDGYRNQRITIYDDFGQKVDSEGNPNAEFFEIIRACNTFPYPLHMADISQKSNTFFKSDYLIGTTNLTNLTPKSVVDSQAISNRMHLAFEVSVRPEFSVEVRSTRGNYGRLRSDIAPSVDVYQFRRLRGVELSPEGDFLSFGEIMDELWRHRVRQRGLESETRVAIGNYVRNVRYQNNVLPVPFIDEEELEVEWLQHMNFIEEDLVNAHAQAEEVRTKLDWVKSWFTVGNCLSLLWYAALGLCGLALGKRVYDLYDRGFRASKVHVDEYHYDICCNAFECPCLAGKIRVGEDARFIFYESGRGGPRTAVRKYESENGSEIIPGRVYESAKTLFQTDVIHFRICMLPDCEKCDMRGRRIGQDAHWTWYESGRGQPRLAVKRYENVGYESWNSLQSAEIAHSLARRSYLEVWIGKPGEQKYFCSVLGLGDRKFLMNRHYLRLIVADGRNCTVRSPGAQHGIFVDFSTCKNRNVSRNGLETDIQLLELPETVPRMRRIWDKFHSVKDVARLDTETYCVLLAPRERNCVQKTGRLTRFDSEPLNIGGDSYRVLIYQFDTRTTAGDCGGVYVADTGVLKGKIIGYHFGGGDSGGSYAFPLFVEDFEELRGDTEVLDPEGLIPEFPEPPPLCGPQYHGRVLEVPGANLRTSIVRTKMFGRVQETTVAPAKLGHVLDPGGAGLRALAKVTGPVIDVPGSLLSRAMESWKSVAYYAQPLEVERRVLDFDEAVAGVAGMPFMKGINRSTSAGWPFSCREPRTKRRAFGETEWLLGESCADIRERCGQRVAQMRRGLQPTFLFVDTLKDETRPIEKVLAGKTRVFSAAPVDFVIIFRQYFLGYISYIMRNRIHNEVAVGMKAQSKEWDTLAMRLLSRGNNMIAGDFTDYDGSLQPSIMYAIRDEINAWYGDGDENSRIRELLFENIVHSWHIVGDIVMGWNHSQPSGNPGTAVFNSIYNSLVCRLCYYRLEPEDAFLVDGFNLHVKMISYGDDNILSVDDLVAGWFNMETISATMSDFGMKYTSEDKSGVLYKTKKLEECMFLKRSFRRDRSGFYLGPLGRNSINEALNWCNKNGNNVVILAETARGCIAEWSLHDDDTFLYWRDRISRVFFECYNIYLPRYTRDYYVDILLWKDFAKAFPQLAYT